MAPSGSKNLSVRIEEDVSAGAEEKEVHDSKTSSGLKSRPKFKPKRVKQKSKRLSGRDLNPELWSHLPERLKVNIFSRLPFQNLFQAATLSKKWRLRVICSGTFQSLVQNNLTPSTWGSYSPLFVNQKKEMVGYEACSERWHRLPSHFYIEEHDLTKNWTLIGAAGSLLCWSKKDHIFVTNPLTRRWKRLKSPRFMMDSSRIVHVVCEESKAYKVILLTVNTQEKPPHSVYVISQIFDSTTNSWTVEVYNTKRNATSRCYGSAYVSGVLYLLLSGKQTRSLGLLISFDVKKKGWNERPLRHYLLFDYGHFLTVDADEKLSLWDTLWDMFFCDISSAQVVVCGSEIFLVVRCNCADVDKLSVFSLDLTTACFGEVARAPEEIFRAGVGEHGFIATGQGDYIVIINLNMCSSFSLVHVQYNVITNEWHRRTYEGLFPWYNPATRIWRHPLIEDTGEGLWRPITYQPGLNPFCEV